MIKQFHDSIELKGKHATVMRDGIYLYMPAEIGINDGRDPNTPVQVLRESKEVEKAYEKFKDLGKLPLTIRHPDMFLDHNDQNVWKNGQADNPELKKLGPVTTIDCLVDIKNDGIKDYEDGTKELSCGWSGEFVKATHGPCEFMQVFHDINHVAIVPAGRCGPMCRINDATIIKENNGGKKTMTIFDRILSFFKIAKIDISDEQEEALKALVDQEEEKDPDKTEDKKKKKKKDEEKEDPDKTEDEEEEENKDKKKKKNDAAIKDAFEKGQKEIRDKFISGMNDVVPILDSFKPSEIKDKTPCEIKAMFIKKQSDTDIKDSDPALDAVFNMVLKNYEHPAYKSAQRTDISDENKANPANMISGLSFNKDAEVK